MGGEICKKMEFNHLVQLNTAEYALEALVYCCSQK